MPAHSSFSSAMLLCLAGSVLATQGGASAADIRSHSTLRLRVGETGRIAVWGAHSADCTTGSPPEIRIQRAPSLGTLSEREGVPYTAGRSISGTCLGARFRGTAVDDTATSPGSDDLQIDAVFSNGTDHRTVAVTVR